MHYSHSIYLLRCLLTGQSAGLSENLSLEWHMSCIPSQSVMVYIAAVLF